MRTARFAAWAALLAACASAPRPLSTEVAQVKPTDLGAELGAAIGRDSVVVSVWQREHRLVARVRDSVSAGNGEGIESPAPGRSRSGHDQYSLRRPVV